MQRRTLFKTLAGMVGLIGITYWQRNALARAALTRFSNGVEAKPALKAGSDVCVLTPEQTSGPYFVQSPKRADITEGLPGLPLDLTIEIVTVPDCAAAQGLTVDIWQCDATGHYSGYADVPVRKPFDTLATIVMTAENGSIPPRDDEVHMRGHQETDAAGIVRFDTILPGWYDPRVAHIHIKVSRGEETFLTTQLYFTDELVSDVYANHPDYAPHGTCPYNLNNDSVLRDLADETGVILQTERTDNQLTATVRLGIA